ncbi:hypothetical protein KEH51_15895 [[Brevibacterium] frigoritolerans]|uniref:Uncharacterized protein n=1 Tax=Peribacillus frigoritolerans TaxID=450367 RepID=A0A941JAX6_9BACI|nr:hypothetical protein [Peribacillus frigoritolerans]
MSIYDKAGNDVSVAVIKPQVKIPDVGLSPTLKSDETERTHHSETKEKAARFSWLKSVL